ncbi:MAG: CDP-alcohol phosphatidyltransferase family protein [Candidatus Cloacimonetes bacterium]|nr:CDP-alcohol phosphatidyltransferase family protein [Candidatus Cloacimonadota bacterium]MCF7815008.1 CDP-alcohol phosphatidyltransferase family protein [Candidatus Cloacimonadota bacterium]MCF7869271.1 CDP-alcohol phosphatidyltransferase family protein [Candidatus Cloacimonadota bacterium]
MKKNLKQKTEENKRKLKEFNLKTIQEFKVSLKHTIFDETLTLYILRPIAFIFVKLLYPTNVTPNQVSLMSIIVGVCAGYFFSRGDLTSFILAGSLYFFCLVLDCVDGMIARLKKNGTAVGRIIDGTADYIVGVAVYVGLGIGFSKGIVNIDFWPYSTWLLLTISAVSHIFHAMIVDYYRVEFMSHGLGKATSVWEEKKIFTQEMERIKHMKGKWLDKILITVYLGYSHLQIFRMKKTEKYDRDAYFQSNKLMILLWFWIGPTAHVFVLIISAILFRPIIFFIYTIGVANLYMLILWIIQVKIKQRLRAQIT